MSQIISALRCNEIDKRSPRESRNRFWKINPGLYRIDATLLPVTLQLLCSQWRMTGRQVWQRRDYHRLLYGECETNSSVHAHMHGNCSTRICKEEDTSLHHAFTTAFYYHAWILCHLSHVLRQCLQSSLQCKHKSRTT